MGDRTRIHAVFLVPEQGTEPLLRPAVDVYRCKEGWLAKFELPGVRLDDVTVSLHEQTLRISGSRRDRITETGYLPYIMEIHYAQFERTIVFPEPLEARSIEVEVREGFLVVRLETDENNDR